jgi:hypothetical protein
MSDRKYMDQTETETVLACRLWIEGNKHAQLYRTEIEWL